MWVGSRAGLTKLGPAGQIWPTIMFRLTRQKVTDFYQLGSQLTGFSHPMAKLYNCSLQPMAQYAELQEMYFKNVFVSLYQISLKLRVHGTR